MQSTIITEAVQLGQIDTTIAKWNKDKRTNNDLQNTAQKAKTRSPYKTSKGW